MTVVAEGVFLVSLLNIVFSYYFLAMFQKPRGTRDFTPEEMFKRRFIEGLMRETFIRFGYQEVQTPTFEELKLFLAKSGSEIIDEIYSFEDKSGRKLALRPELTAPVIRFYVNQMQMKPKPLKLFYFGNCFRYDRPQMGRYREFKQAGCELIGADTPESYAELIALAYSLMDQVGLKNIRLNIGDLVVLSAMFKKIGLSDEKIGYLRPLIDKSQFNDVFSALIDFNVDEEDAKIFLENLQTSDVEKLSEYVRGDEKAETEMKQLEAVTSLLEKSFNVKVFNLKMSIVRGLDYYRGLVFEIEAESLGAESQLAGGGAYELVSLFGGKETPTMGFAVGFDRVILALENEKHMFPELNLEFFVIPVNEQMLNKTIEITQLLRKHGLRVDVDLKRRGVGRALKHADSLKAEKAVIVGPTELKENSVTVRDLRTGEQKKVLIKQLYAEVDKNRR